MTHKEVHRRVLRRRVAVLAGALLVIAASVAIRFFLIGSSHVRAEVPPDGVAGRAQRPAAARPAGSAAARPAGSQPAAIPEVVAVVNGQPLGREDLAKRSLERYGERVLESLVNKHLILQACQQQGITIGDQDIDQEIANTASQFRLSTDQWLKMLHAERNISPTQYRRDIIWPMLALRRLAADQLDVTPEELQRELESEFGPKVQVRMIAVSRQEEAKRLRQLAIDNPGQFGALAKEHSQDPNSAAARGLIPPVRRHTGNPEIERVVFSLQPGDISPLLEVHGQFLIFKCERHLPATQIGSEHREFVEERLRERIRDEKLREAAAEIFERLQADATVVNVMNDPEQRRKMPGVAATINGKPVTLSYLADECMARHGADVLEAEIHFVLLQQALQQAGLEVTRQDLQQEMARLAESFGYLDAQGRPDVQRWLKDETDREEVTIDYYVRDAVWPLVALRKLVADRVRVTAEDLQKGFESHYGERVEVLAIVLSNQRMAQQVWEEARANPTREAFAQLAAKYSIEPVSRTNLGEVPPVQRHSDQPALENEAFQLKPGEISGIVAVGDQYVILYCLGRTEPIVRHLDEVREELTGELHQRKLRLAMARRFDELKEKAQVENFLAGTFQKAGPPAARKEAAVRPAAATR